MKNLVAYFSATGTTKKAAENVARLVNGELFEIDPVEKYTSEDLNWTDNNSRTSKEKQDESIRPLIARKVDSIEQYDNVLVFFPVWWYKAPNIIYSFLDSYNLDGKNIIPFCTLGGTGISGCEENLRRDYPNLNIKKGLRISGSVSKEIINDLLK